MKNAINILIVGAIGIPFIWNSSFNWAIYMFGVLVGGFSFAMWNPSSNGSKLD